MQWVMHSVFPEDLQPADHIYRWASPVHRYHGIVLEVSEVPQPSVAELELQDRIVVLHFSFDGNGQAKVHRVTLRQFLEPILKAPLQGLKRARYGCPKYETWMKCSGTCYPEPASPPEECLARARSLLETSESHPYSLDTLTSANCEHFAVWCSTGKWRSAQKDRARLIGTAALGFCAGPIGWVAGVYLWRKSVGEEEVDAWLVGDGSLSDDTQEPGDNEQIGEDDQDIRLSDNDSDDGQERSDDVHFAPDLTWTQPQLDSDGRGNSEEVSDVSNALLCLAKSLREHVQVLSEDLSDDGDLSPDHQDDSNEYEIIN